MQEWEQFFSEEDAKPTGTNIQLARIGYEIHLFRRALGGMFKFLDENNKRHSEPEKSFRDFLAPFFSEDDDEFEVVRKKKKPGGTDEEPEYYDPKNPKHVARVQAMRGEFAAPLGYNHDGTKKKQPSGLIVDKDASL